MGEYNVETILFSQIKNIIMKITIKDLGKSEWKKHNFQWVFPERK